MESSTSCLWSGPFPIKGLSDFFFYYYHLYFIEITVFNANSVDPDQTPRSAASDLGLHCLLVFLLWGAMHKWVKRYV